MVAAGGVHESVFGVLKNGERYRCTCMCTGVYSSTHVPVVYKIQELHVPGYMCTNSCTGTCTGTLPYMCVK